MITFIKDYKLDCIRKKFFLLYILNVTDIIFTLLLLQTGYFSEVNILMVKAVQSPAASFFLKIILPAVLLYYIYQRIKKAEAFQLKTVNIVLTIALTIYGLVNLSHIVWIILLPAFMRQF